MNDELRATAERLLKWAEKHADDPAAMGKPHVRALIHDCGKLARAYLAEHPADDGEPVTVEWLAECGFERNARYFTLPNYSGNLFDVVLWADGFNVRWDGHTNCKTRGEVRRLCAALGIQLAEGEG